MFRDVWRSLTRLIDPIDASLRSSIRKVEEEKQRSEVLEIQTLRSDKVDFTPPVSRIYEYTVTQTVPSVDLIDETIQLDLFGNYKTRQFLKKAMISVSQEDPEFLNSQHILLRSASGWTAHIHIPTNPYPTYYHLRILTDSVEAAVLDGQIDALEYRLAEHQIFAGTWVPKEKPQLQ